MAQADLAQLAGQPRRTEGVRPWKEADVSSLRTTGLDSCLYVLSLVLKYAILTFIHTSRLAVYPMIHLLQCSRIRSKYARPFIH